MPDHVFTVVAKGTSVDSQTNSLSLFSVLESIGAPGLPVAVPELVLATVWYRRPGEEDLTFVQRARLADPDGREIATAEISFQLTKPRHRVFNRFRMVPFHRTGLHRIEVQIRREDESSWSRPVASYPLDVDLLQPKDEKGLFSDAADPPPP